MQKINLVKKCRNSNETRKNNNIPVIVYGKDYNKEFAVNNKEFTHLINHLEQKTLSTLIELKDEKEEFKALIKAIQFHPVTDEILHIDFLKIEDNKPFIVNAKVTIVNFERAPFQKENATLYMPTKKAKILCTTKNMISEIICDVSKMHKGDVMRSSDEEFKHITFDKNYVLVTIVDR